MSRRLIFSLTVVCAALFVLGGSVPAGAQCQTYSTAADFDLGLLINLNHNAPYEDQLQLNVSPTPFPFVNIACSQRGTVVRIDVNTGAILGEYLTAPDEMGRNPSRTTVDQLGNVWVANRDEYGGGMGSVCRIALIIGGTRCNADGSPNPGGQYLKPPFLYSTAVDRDGDGLIMTSTGLGNILPWTNAGGADVNGGVSTAADECIINYTRTVGTGTRTVAVDANNDVWVGGLGDRDHELLSGVTGQPIPGTQFNIGCGGYGGLIDPNGVLWSSSGSPGLVRFVPNPTPPPAGAGVCLDGSHGDYGLGIDPNTGHIWHTFLSAGLVAELDAAGNVLNTYPHGNAYAQGVAVDAAGNVWVAHSLIGPSTTVGHLLTNGTYVGNVPLPGGIAPTGVAIDANGKVWVANLYSNNAMRINPLAGPIGGGGVPVGAVDLVVDLGPDAGPYNYSDMTGFVTVGSTAPQGSWTVIYDGGDPGTNWGKVCWNQDACAQPLGTGIEVRVRSSEDQVTWSDWVIVENCVDFAVADGRYLQVDVKLTPNAEGESPVLCDITICTGIVPVAVDIKPTSCPNPFHLKPDGTPVQEQNFLDLRQIHSAAVSPSDKSVLPVAVLGTSDFDVTLIDPESVTLAGVSPLRWCYEDVAAPLADPDECECTTAGPDGYLDLTLKFNRAEIAAALGPFADGDYIPLELLGELSDGRQIQGFDCVWIKITGRAGFASADDGFGLNSYPNPFNARTTVSYRLDNDGPVELAVFNVLGQRVATLVDEFQSAGEHSVVWDGGSAASGTYFYRLSAAGRVSTRMMTLLK